MSSTWFGVGRAEGPSSTLRIVTVQELSRVEARRIAVRAQLLDSSRPTDLVDMVRRLTLLQLDPTAAIAPNADLVAWSRLGASYQPADLELALRRRELLEFASTIRPAEDLALYRAQMTEWPLSQKRREWLAANGAFRQDILDRLESVGPLQSRELPDTCKVPWGSTGWTNNNNVTQMLETMVARGQVAIAGRTGRERLWDLAWRVYPDQAVVPAVEAWRIRNERRLQALGIARAKAQISPVEPWDVGEVGEPAVVEGVRGTWRVDPATLGQPFSGRAALLSPFDRLVHDRKRALELFGFDYQLEMYKPAAQRRWGYFALPILYGDRLVGKLDAAADRKGRVLRVHAIHEDEAFTRATAAAVDREIKDLARWLDLDLVLPRHL